jgi:hypothetical protein
VTAGRWAVSKRCRLVRGAVEAGPERQDVTDRLPGGGKRAAGGGTRDPRFGRDGPRKKLTVSGARGAGRSESDECCNEDGF